MKDRARNLLFKGCMDKRLILSLLSFAILSACARAGFETVAEDDPIVHKFTSPSTETSDGKSGKISSSQGDLEWKTAGDQAQGLRYSYTLKIPYGRVYGTLSKLTHWMAPYACQWTDIVQSSSASSYAKGEIPCGAVLDANWKQVLALKVDPMSGTSSGVNYSITGATVPVYMSRGTYTGNYTEASLDSKKSVQRASSRKFAEDISLRFTPNGKTSQLEMCANVPGTAVSARTTTIHATAWKRVLGIKISEGSDFTIHPGMASFEYGRACFAVNFGWADKALAPTVQLVSTQKPVLANVKYEGLTVRIGDWFLRLVDNIMDAFNVSFKRSLIEKAVRQVNDIADRDIETGAWFTKVNGEDVLKKTSQKLNQRFAKALSRAGIPASTTDLRAMIHDSCRLKKLSLSDDWTQRLETFCETMVDKTRIEIQPFAVDSDSKTAGCYDYFARIHDVKDSSGNKKWWADRCRFATSFAITLPPELTAYRKELETLIGDLVSDKRIPQEWKDAFEELEIDEYLMKLVLEELQKRGVNQIQGRDWKNNLTSLIQQIRGKVALAAE